MLYDIAHDIMNGDESNLSAKNIRLLTLIRTIGKKRLELIEKYYFYDKI
jgi:hypothetical protein